MQTLWQDLRYGARILLKQPGFTLIAVITLSLGIGANTAIFSAVYAVLLHPLPFTQQERLVVAWKKDTTSGSPFVELSPAEFRDWQAQQQTFDSLAALPTTAYGYGFVMTGRGEPVQLESSTVTGSFFSMLGTKPALGRLISEADDLVNAPKVAVLSDGLWRQRFGADPNIIGQTVTLNKRGFTIVGVMPAGFEFLKGVDLWAPLAATSSPRALENRGVIFLQAAGRLKAGVTIEQAETELNTIIARVAEQHPETEAKGHRVVIAPMADHLFGNARPALWLLLAAAGLLLLIASANIANLLLARATSRRREFAVRSALGARRGRIVQQLLCESLLLAVCGGVAGVLLAYWLVGLLVAIAPADIPRIGDVRLNITVLSFSAAITLLTALAFGLFPALAAFRINLNNTLNEGSGKLSGERSGKQFRDAMVVAEITLTMVLLAGAMLVLRSFVNLSRVNLGFNPHNVLTMQLRKNGSAEVRREFFRQLIARLEAQPGVVAASAVLIRPLEGTVGWEAEYALEGQSPHEARQNTVANYEVVTPHYFRTFSLPLKAGREFNEYDQADTERVVIISETMAERLFGSSVQAIGKRIRLDPSEPDEPWRTIVGVAGDVRYRELQNIRWDIYRPHTQSEVYINHFAVLTMTDPIAFLPMVRREVAALDANLPVNSVTTMDQLVADKLAPPRFNAVLFNSLSALALLLAAVGIYGTLAYSVAQRTGELGIRAALGAQTKDILKLVIEQGMRLVAVGLVLGLVTSFALTRLMAKLLFGVSATDPPTFAVIALLLVAVALLACWLPARRATKVDPMIAFKCE
jgi:putative ABC transport system permease protein